MYEIPNENQKKFSNEELIMGMKEERGEEKGENKGNFNGKNKESNEKMIKGERKEGKGGMNKLNRYRESYIKNEDSFFNQLGLNKDCKKINKNKEKLNINREDPLFLMNKNKMKYKTQN